MNILLYFTSKSIILCDVRYRSCPLNYSFDKLYMIELQIQPHFGAYSLIFFQIRCMFWIRNHAHDQLQLQSTFLDRWRFTLPLTPSSCLAAHLEFLHNLAIKIMPKLRTNPPFYSLWNWTIQIPNHKCLCRHYYYYFSFFVTWNIYYINRELTIIEMLMPTCRHNIILYHGEGENFIVNLMNEWFLST